MQIILLRLHALSRPFVGIVVAPGRVPLKNIGPISMQRFSQVLQQHLQRLVRRFLQQGDAKPLVDYGLQILNSLHTAVLLMALRGQRTFFRLFKILPYITHKPALHMDRFPIIAAVSPHMDT